MASATRPLFDSHRAWTEALGLIRANRDVLWPLAGVFFVLPGLLAAVLLPLPENLGELDADHILALVQDHLFYSLPLMLPPVVGMLAIQVIALDPRASLPGLSLTLGQALGRALLLAPWLIIAQLLVGLAAGGYAGLGGAVLTPLLGARLGQGVGLTLALYPMLRTMLAGPALAAGVAHGPLGAITASLKATRGQSLRLLAFLALVLFLFGLLFLLGNLGGGLVSHILLAPAGTEAQRFGAEVVSAVLVGLGYTAFAAILAAIQRQLGAIQG